MQREKSGSRSQKMAGLTDTNDAKNERSEKRLHRKCAPKVPCMTIILPEI